MGLSAEWKHLIHVIFCLSFIILFEVLSGALTRDATSNVVDPIETYGLMLTCVLYVLRVASLLVLPQAVFNLIGLLAYNGFREKVNLKGAPMMTPCICFRVVTRGDFPKMVQSNVETNMQLVEKVGITNYMFEVVTDKAIALHANPRVREVVVQSSYRTKTLAMYKARALQYCLEDDVNILRDDDWIVHLDEETLLTENSIRGICNFCMSGEHPFGQGLITYASGPIINWITTLCDSFRVADDLGKLRAQFKLFHKPLFGWKGSYVVTRMKEERAVSFDHGPDGSIAEDCYFGMVAMSRGYSFDFIEGEMHEKSPFVLMPDFIKQRKRWLQGIYLVVHSKHIPVRHKILLAMSLYAWLTLPLTVWNLVLNNMAPLPPFILFDTLVAFVGAINLYMYVFGAVKSFAHKCRDRPLRLVLYTMAALLAVPINVTAEIIAVMWGLFGNKHDFFVVDKDWKKMQPLDVEVGADRCSSEDDLAPVLNV